MKQLAEWESLPHNYENYFFFCLHSSNRHVNVDLWLLEEQQRELLSSLHYPFSYSLFARLSVCLTLGKLLSFSVLQRSHSQTCLARFSRQSLLLLCACHHASCNETRPHVAAAFCPSPAPPFRMNAVIARNKCISITQIP